MNTSQLPAFVRFEAKGRVSLPVAALRRLGIRNGTKVAIVATTRSILLRPITADYIHSLRGKHKNLPLLEILTDERIVER